MSRVAASASGVSIEFPREDVRRLFAAMERARRDVGKGLGQSLKFAAWSVSSTLGAATNVAPKYRAYSEAKEPRAAVLARGGKRRFDVTSMKRGAPKTFAVYATSVAALKRTPQVRIGKAGLAKSAWFWGLRKLGSSKGFSMKGATDAARKTGRGVVDVTQRLRGDDPMVKISNRLGYAGAALRGGTSAITSALGKAARHMEHVVSGQIAKKMGAK